MLFSHAAASGESLRLAALTGLRPHADKYSEIDNPAAFYRKLINANAPLPITTIPRYQPYFSPGGGTSPTALQPADLPRQADLGWFQPASVNLADEEMDIVCRSGGLVALTMEQRALGTSMPRWEDDPQFGNKIIKQQLRTLLNAGQITVHTLNGDQEEFIRRFLAVAPFVRNLTHLVAVTSPAYDPWRHLAIGSDFDGLIDPVDYFHTSDRLPDLEQFLIDYFDLYCTLYQLPRTALLTRGGHTYTVEEAMRRVFSQNGIAFISRHFPR